MPEQHPFSENECLEQPPLSEDECLEQPPFSEDECLELRETARQAALTNGADPDRAEDVGQMTFIRLTTKWPSSESMQAAYDAGGKRWTAYIVRVATRIHTELMRSEKRRTLREQRATGSLDPPLPRRPGTMISQEIRLAGTVEEFLGRQLIADEITRLPHRLQKTAELIFLDGHTNRQVADLLQIQIQTVRQRRRRIVSLLQKRIKPEDLLN